MRLFLFILALAFNAQADQLAGRVVKVADGDTITILDSSNTQHKIRLSGIDAPERKQAFGDRSKQALADVVAGRDVVIDWNKRDRYKRIVGKVLVSGQDINLQQVRNGMAWHYITYQDEQDPVDRSLYAQAEYAAQGERLGLWADKYPQAPWQFRRAKKNVP